MEKLGSVEGSRDLIQNGTVVPFGKKQVVAPNAQGGHKCELRGKMEPAPEPAPEPVRNPQPAPEPAPEPPRNPWQLPVTSPEPAPARSDPLPHLSVLSTIYNDVSKHQVNGPGHPPTQAGHREKHLCGYNGNHLAANARNLRLASSMSYRRQVVIVQRL